MELSSDTKDKINRLAEYVNSIMAYRKCSKEEAYQIAAYLSEQERNEREKTQGTKLGAAFNRIWRAVVAAVGDLEK